MGLKLGIRREFSEIFRGFTGNLQEIFRVLQKPESLEVWLY
jgi:hypothetical protein